MLDLYTEEDEYIREYSFEPEILVKRKKRQKRKHLHRQSESIELYDVGKSPVDIEVEAFSDVSVVTDHHLHTTHQGGHIISFAAFFSYVVVSFLFSVFLYEKLQTCDQNYASLVSEKNNFLIAFLERGEQLFSKLLNQDVRSLGEVCANSLYIH